MNSAIRQTVTVERDGRIEIRSPQLQSGASAEVILLVSPGRSRPAVLALDDLQRSMRLDQSAAQNWIDQVQDERMSNTRLSGAKAG